MKTSTLNKNILYLFFIQILRFIIPFITFPYLTRTLGVESFGYLGFSSAIIIYSMIICQFGFDLTATARISKIKSKKEQLNRYCTGVYQAKFLLFIIAMVFVGLMLIIEKDPKLKNLVLVMIPMAIGYFLVPNWLFQGLEKIKHLTFITFISRIVIIPFTFVLVNSPQDIYIAGFIQALPFFVSGIVSICYVYYNKLFELKLSNYKYIIKIIKSSWNIFLVNLSSSMYLNMFPVLIGLLCGPTSVAYFSVAQNVKNICTAMLSTIYQAIYPRINSLVDIKYDEAVSVIRKYFLITVCISFLGCCVIQIFTTEIILIIAGEDFLDASFVVLLLNVSVFIGVFNNFFGVQTMVPLKKTKQLKNIVGLFSILSVILSYPLLTYYDFYGAGFIMIFVEIGIFFSLLYFHIKNKINFIIKWTL